MAYFYSKLLLTLIGFILCIPAFFKEKREVPLTLLFVLFFFLNEILTTSMAIFGIRDIIGKEWNWSGKILASIVFIIIILVLRRYKKFDFGFTFKQKKGSLKPVLIFIGIILIIHIVSLWFTVSKGKPSLESHLFQLTIPGISEEIAYRGLLLGILNVVFKKRIKIWGASLGYGTVVISILFGLIHGLGFENDLSFFIHWEQIIMLTLGGFMLAWIRERSGSLLMPVIFHNLINELGNIIMLIK